MSELAREYGLCPIFFVAPTTSAERIRRAAEQSRGFLYVIGRFGVTGGETKLDPNLVGFLERVRAATQLPVAVGFGIATREHVATITQPADIAIVGSALVEHIHRAGQSGGDDAAVQAAHDFVADLLQGVQA
jgi:tryptophan synthase alpha chain